MAYQDPENSGDYFRVDPVLQDPQIYIVQKRE
jgi:hypothetical protein